MTDGFNYLAGAVAIVAGIVGYGITDDIGVLLLVCTVAIAATMLECKNQIIENMR